MEVPAGSAILDRRLTDVLRGDNPELRPAVTRALVDAVGDGSAYDLAELAQSVLPIPVSGLLPRALAHAGDPRLASTLSQLVHIVDRSGVLVSFLTTAADRLPHAEPLQRAARAVSTWDDAQRGLFDLLAASPP